MPGKIALLIFDKCQPCRCPEGKCAAMLACRQKMIKQEAPGEMPMFSPAACKGCSDCLRACPQKAIRIVTV